MVFGGVGATYIECAIEMVARCSSRTHLQNYSRER